MLKLSFPHTYNKCVPHKCLLNKEDVQNSLVPSINGIQPTKRWPRVFLIKWELSLCDF